jgi:hypothetical protein
MRALFLGSSLTSSDPKTLPEPLTADIRALFWRHLLKGGVMGESDDPRRGIVA